MRIINKALAVSALILTTQMAQAHVTEDVTHTHDGTQMRSTIQAMSPTDRLEFRGTMQTNLEGMPVEDRQAFRDTMRTSQGIGEGQGMGKDMSPEERQAFRDTRRSGEGTGQNNQFMHGGSQGGSQGGDYGRGYGKR